MELNFGSIANSGNGGNFLRAWNIYEDVKFSGVSEPTTGTSSQGNEWKAWDFTFSSPSGDFVKKIFAPTETTIKRGTYKNKNGHEMEWPSGFEESKEFIAQIVRAYSPEGFKKLQEIASKIRTFDELIQVVTKLLSKTTVTTKLKLAGRTTQDGKTYADIPRLCGVNSKTGEVFTSNVFVGDKVMFSDYELTQKEKYESRRPTSMPSEKTVDELGGPIDDSDNEDLLAELGNL